jgi:predicted transcriptional regulator
MGFKPQLAIQLKKSGNAKQARKKYKVTKEGIKKVEEMLRSGS